ncbi:hypothetical protein KCU89_g16873, partial [Aureobasidium melanogenum]
MIAGDSSQHQHHHQHQQSTGGQQHHHHQQQPRPRPANRAQNGLILQDVPSFDSRDLLRPTSIATTDSPYPAIQPSPRSPRPRARTFVHAKYLTDPEDPTRRSLPHTLTATAAMPPANYQPSQQRHVSATAAEHVLRQQQQSQQQYMPPPPPMSNPPSMQFPPPPPRPPTSNSQHNA